MVETKRPPSGAAALPRRSDWIFYARGQVPPAAAAALRAVAKAPDDPAALLVAASLHMQWCMERLGAGHRVEDTETVEAALSTLRLARRLALLAPQEHQSWQLVHNAAYAIQSYGLAPDLGDSPSRIRQDAAGHLRVLAEHGKPVSLDVLEASRDVVVRHTLYETGRIVDGLRDATMFKQRLASAGTITKPEQPSSSRRLVFGEEWTGYMGHIGLLDCYVKGKMLGLMDWEELIVPVLPGKRIANRAFLDRWAPWIRIIERYEDAVQLAGRTTREPVGLSVSLGRRETYWGAAFAETQRRWEEERRSPLLTLGPEDHLRAAPFLERLGIPPGQPHICVHAREAGYHKEGGSASQKHRNADIMAFIPAIERLTGAGYAVVRMGDPSMRPLPAMPGVIDYCHHPVRDPWLDVYLVASARFFLGCTSGLVMVAHVFDVPTAVSQFVPGCARPYTRNDLFIPKRYVHTQSDKPLSFREALAPPVGSIFYYERLQEMGIGVIDNTQEEITDLAEEMLEQIEGGEVEADDVRSLRQAYDRMNALSPWFGMNGRISGRFLRRHADLMGDGQ